MMGLGLGLGFGSHAAAEWVPTVISGLKLWLRPDAAALTLVGSKVSVWADQSGVGDANRNAVQGTDAARPTRVLSDASYNGKPTLTFAGVQNLVTGTWSAPLAQPATWIVVAHDPGTTDDVLLDGIDGTNRHFIDRHAAGTISIFAGGAQPIVTANWQTPKANLVEFNGASSAVYFNNFTAATGSSLNPGAASLFGLTLGSTFSAGALWSGTVAEVLAFNKVLSSTEKGLLRTYLNARYALAIS